MSLFRAPILVLDTETTGLPSHSGARPIDIGIVVVGTDGTILEEYSSLVRSHDEPKPPFYAEFALKLTGIRWEEVLAAPPIEQVLAEIEAVAARHSHYVAAYNREFDREMMRRMGLPERYKWCSDIMVRAMIPYMRDGGVLHKGDPWHPQHNPSFPWLFPPLAPNGKGKVSAAEFFGVELEKDAHRALPDARVAARVLVEIQRRFMASLGGAK